MADNLTGFDAGDTEEPPVIEGDTVEQEPEPDEDSEDSTPDAEESE